jgi:hypothetical protein
MSNLPSRLVRCSTQNRNLNASSVADMHEPSGARSPRRTARSCLATKADTEPAVNDHDCRPNGDASLERSNSRTDPLPVTIGRVSRCYGRPPRRGRVDSMRAPVPNRTPKEKGVRNRLSCSLPLPLQLGAGLQTPPLSLELGVGLMLPPITPTNVSQRSRIRSVTGRGSVRDRPQHASKKRRNTLGTALPTPPVRPRRCQNRFARSLRSPLLAPRSPALHFFNAGGQKRPKPPRPYGMLLPATVHFALLKPTAKNVGRGARDPAHSRALSSLKT